MYFHQHLIYSLQNTRYRKTSSDNNMIIRLCILVILLGVAVALLILMVVLLLLLLWHLTRLRLSTKDQDTTPLILSSITASPQDPQDEYFEPNLNPDTQAPLLCRVPPCPPALATLQTFILERIRSGLEGKGHTLEVRLLTWYKLQLSTPRLVTLVLLW